MQNTQVIKTFVKKPVNKVVIYGDNGEETVIVFNRENNEKKIIIVIDEEDDAEEINEKQNVEENVEDNAKENDEVIDATTNLEYNGKNNGYIVNLTTGEYFVSSNDCRESKLKLLFTKLNVHNTVLNESVGTSRWEKTDIIKLIPKKYKKLCEYIEKNYSAVWLHKMCS